MKIKQTAQRHSQNINYKKIAHIFIYLYFVYFVNKCEDEHVFSLLPTLL